MEEANCSSLQTIHHEDYDSDFEYDAEAFEKKKRRHDLTSNPTQNKIFKPNRQIFHDLCSKETGRAQQQAYLALNAYARHKKLINDYVLCYKGATDKLKRNASNYKTDYDVIRENHKFLWDDDENAETWGQQLAKKYYDRLFKEYCLCDLSRYKEKKIGMRWRTEKELVIGKGQFFCGNVHCNDQDNLNSWEVLFGYIEHGEKKSALVKLRLCDRCSEKLHYGYKGKAVLKNNQLLIKKENEKIVELNNSKDASPNTVCDNTDECNIWRNPVTEELEQSKEDAFEEFLEDLFL